jgi:hypothetical protein
MVLLDNIIEYLSSLGNKQFKQIIFSFLGIVLCLIIVVVYYTYDWSNDIVEQIKKVKGNSGKITSIISKYEVLKSEERRIDDLLEANKNFNLQVYFEKFCSENSVTAEPGWNVAVSTTKNEFEEINLRAAFKDITTQKLVSLLVELDKLDIIYVKELLLKSEKSKKITVNFVLGTKRRKSSTNTKGK